MALGGMAVGRSGSWSKKLRARIFSSKGEAEREPEAVHGLNPGGLPTRTYFRVSAWDQVFKCQSL